MFVHDHHTTREMVRSIFVSNNIQHAPVPLDQLLQQYGVRFQTHDISLLSYPICLKYQLTGKYCISIPDYPDPNDCRWNTAVMLGHILLNHFEVELPDTLYQDNRSDQLRTAHNHEADIFAEELLIPYDWITGFSLKVVSHENLLELKNRFQVPWEPLMRRLSQILFRSAG